MTNQQAKQDQGHVSSHDWLVVLLLIVLLGTAAPTFADTTPSHADTSAVSIGIAHSPLVDSRLEDIRGRYAPPATLEMDNPIAVILWDEGAPGQTGASKRHQRSDGQANLQRTTLQSHSVR